MRIPCAWLIALIVTSTPLLAQTQAPQSPPAGSKEKRESFGSSSRSQARSYAGETIIRYENARILSAIWWEVDPNLPVTRLEVRLSEQKVYVFQGDRMAALSPISSGRSDYPTKPGEYRVLNKSKNHFSNLYGSFVDIETGKVVNPAAKAGQKPPPGTQYRPSPMPNFLRLTYAGLGLHAGYLPGQPDSHGCIRLPQSFSEDLFAVVPVGTPVSIIP